MKFNDWPEVPEEQRPKRLPVDSIIPSEQLSQLLFKGWQPVDVRLMANESDAERAESLKAMLEGVRLGSIAPDNQKLKFCELEAQIYGLRNSKGPSAAKSLETADLTKLLDFSSPRAFRGTFNSVANQVQTKTDAPEVARPKRAAKRKVPFVSPGEKTNSSEEG